MELTKLEALRVKEKVALDLYKTAKTTEEKAYYRKELEGIRKEVNAETANVSDIRYLLVPADTVSELKDIVAADNLIEMAVSKECVEAYIATHGFDKETWFDHYKPIDLNDFYDFVVAGGWKYELQWI